MRKWRAVVYYYTSRGYNNNSCSIGCGVNKSGFSSPGIGI